MPSLNPELKPDDLHQVFLDVKTPGKACRTSITWIVEDHLACFVYISITLKKWLNIHVNDSNEISLELEPACDRLTRAGIPLGDQSVVLAGVTDNVHIQRKVVRNLVRIRVCPYCLGQCDLVEGAGHFRLCSPTIFREAPLYWHKCLQSI